jgi:hypothetical protein
MQNPVNVDLDTEKLRADVNEIRTIAANVVSLAKKAVPSSGGFLSSAFVWAQNVALGFFLGFAVATGQIKPPAPLPPAPWPIPIPFPPTPGPTPPAPIPVPPPVPPVPPAPPAPISAPGLRVLIVYEAADLGKYPATQVSILSDGSLRAYLLDHCPKGADGKTAEFRIWDKDVDASGDAKLWQDALKLPRERTPWIVVSNGVTGTQQPLPDNVADTLKLIQKFEVK